MVVVQDVVEIGGRPHDLIDRTDCHPFGLAVLERARRDQHDLRGEQIRKRIRLIGRPALLKLDVVRHAGSGATDDRQGELL